MSLSFERLYPFLFAIASSILALVQGASLPTDASFCAGLLSAAISASAIFVGFVATAKSIIMALPTEGIRKQLHDSGYIIDLACYLNQAMAGNLFFCALNIGGFFPAVQSNLIWFTPLWVGLGVFSLLAFWRVGRFMSAILRMR